MLVIYARWDDVDFPPGFDAAMVARRYFGPFPSVANYFRTASFGQLILTPALDTQGTVFDGVVQVHIPGTKADFFTLSTGQRTLAMLEAADEFVDFSIYDLNGDGRLTDLELVVNTLEANPLPPGRGLGITINIAPPRRFDGTALDGLHPSLVGTHTALITIIHENVHAVLHAIDLYGFGVGKFDPVSVGGDDTEFYLPTAWQKMHWGWIAPTVVVGDGFYNVGPAWATVDAFILYDPDRGTDEYFVVEYRQKAAGSYDASASDEGLVIWRIDETAFNNPANPTRPIELMRPDGITLPPDYGGSKTDAWNPADPATPQRTMVGTWKDGTPSNVAVRAIGGAGEVVRAYLDVRGPGILVDTYPVDSPGPVRLTAAGANQIDIPIMNTGEQACDTFVFEAVDLPVAWTMGAGVRILCAGETSFARVTVMPDANADVGLNAITIRGRSLTNPTVSTDAPLVADVVLRSTKHGLAGLLAMAPINTAPSFEVLVSDEEDPLQPGLAGVAVTFTLSGPGGSFSFPTTTDATGLARVTPFITLAPGSYTLTVSSDRSGAHAPATTSIAFDVLSIEGSLERAVDWIDALLVAAPSAGVRSDLRAARDQLAGNRGFAGNGALDKLDAGAPVAAITKLREALWQLLHADTRGANSPASLKELLVLAAEAIATTEYEEAKAAVGTPNAGEQRALERIAELIEAGRAQLLADRYVDACETFREGAARAQGLAR
jgi:M6 family metalloprotease-like protein